MNDDVDQNTRMCRVDKVPARKTRELRPNTVRSPVIGCAARVGMPGKVRRETWASESVSVGGGVTVMTRADTERARR
jgi:hypothetical protein